MSSPIGHSLTHAKQHRVPRAGCRLFRRRWGERPREPSPNFGVRRSAFGVRCSPNFLSALQRTPGQPSPRRPDPIHKYIFRVGQRMSVPIRQSERVNDNQTSWETKIEGRGPREWRAGSGGFGNGKAARADVRPRPSIFVSPLVSEVPIHSNPFKEGWIPETSNAELRTPNIKGKPKIRPCRAQSRPIVDRGAAFEPPLITHHTSHITYHHSLTKPKIFPTVSVLKFRI